LALLRRINNIFRFGLGSEALLQKRAYKSAARRAVFDSGDLWERQDGFATRRYQSYEAYLEHQATKLDRVSGRLEETRIEDQLEFKRRFEGCEALQAARSVLCLGARLGTEVKVLLDLGHFAVGIDLNPGHDNPYVLKGDFHRLVFPDGSADAIYTNALDHVFDLGRVMAEVRRVLRPDGGLFVVDMLDGYEEGFTPGRYESAHWASREALQAEIAARGGLELVEARDLGQHRRDRWTQVVFRKGA
jgi:SAM-dependent methyltransferase